MTSAGEASAPDEVFISYASPDRSTAHAACAALEAGQVPCWIAPRNVRAGHDYVEEIVDAIDRARVLVLVLSSSANVSEHVRREVERAAARHVPIVPLRIQEVQPSKALEYFIGLHQWLDALTPPLEEHLRRLVDTVGGLLGRGETVATHAVRSPPPDERLSFERVLREPQALVGMRLGPYLLKAPIGSGGTGLVYAAWNPGISQKACVKVFRPLRIETAAVAATMARVGCVAAIDHPNVVKVFHFDRFELSDGASFYLAMELVPGLPLDEWTRTLPDDEEALRERVRVALAVTAALEAAHTCRYCDESGFERSGILHGDLKPANVRVRPDGMPVVFDFAMVDVQRLLELPTPGLDGDLTTAFGTPGFMAPEQARDGVVTVRTDVYGLGVTFCHLFFPDTKPEPIAAVWEDGTSDRVRPLRLLLREMLAREPDRRPRDMHTVAARLAAAAASMGLSPLLGRYQVRRQLGSDMTGPIYLAQDQSLRRRCVVKEMVPGMAISEHLGLDPRRTLDALVAGARLLASLEHPRLPRVQDLVVQEERAYLVLEHVEGQYLSDFVARHPTGVPEGTALAIIEGVLDAVVHCFERARLVHGDIKPSHVRLRRQSREAVLLQVETALLRRRRRTGAAATRGEAGDDDDRTTIVTPGYSPPEQYLGMMDPASDVYALGATLYHMLTGQRAPESPDEQCVPPRALNAGISPALEAVVLRAMASDPRARYQTAAELRDAVRAIRGGNPERRREGVATEALRRPVVPNTVDPRDAVAMPGAQASGKRQWVKRMLERWWVPPTRRARRTDPVPDTIQFTVTSVRPVVAGGVLRVDVWAHLEAQRTSVLERGREVSERHALGRRTPESMLASSGTVFDVVLHVDGIEIAQPRAVLAWTGEAASVTFSARVPEDAASGPRQGRAAIHVAGLRIACVYFDIDVRRGDETMMLGRVQSWEERHHKAFASFGESDLDAVLSRIQALRTVVPNLEVCLDVTSCRSEQSWERDMWQVIPRHDVFYLFWSQHARQSAWIEREWRCALRTRGAEFIAPVPLMSLEQAPAPAELRSNRLEDWAPSYGGSVRQ